MTCWEKYMISMAGKSTTRQILRFQFKHLFMILICCYVLYACTVYFASTYLSDFVASMDKLLRRYNIRGIVVIEQRPKGEIDIELEKLYREQFNISKDSNTCPWPPTGLVGRQKLNKSILSFEVLENIYSFMVNGHYRPKCKPYQNVALIVPYRNREPQLKAFFNNVLPRIYRQQQEFGIYLIEQADSYPFNRGMLANIGYQFAMKEYKYDCIVIHDLDLLPEDDRNLYFCTNQSVNHMVGKMERHKYRLPYPGFAGGITSMTAEMYKKSNGFSNTFFGWGGEDDNFKTRLNYAGFHLRRPLEIFSHCGDIKHEKAKPAKHRYKVMDKASVMWKLEGLNSLKYKLLEIQKKKLYTLIRIHIDENVYGPQEDLPNT